MAWTDDITGNGYDLTDGSATGDYYDNDTSPSILNPADGNAYQKTTAAHTFYNGGLFRNNADVADILSNDAANAPPALSVTFWLYPDAGDTWATFDTILQIGRVVDFASGAATRLEVGFRRGSGTQSCLYRWVGVNQMVADPSTGNMPTGEWSLYYARVYEDALLTKLDCGMRGATVGTKDGTAASSTTTGTDAYSSDLIHLGAFSAARSCIKHNIEQLCIWNHKITTSFVDGLYNSGSGRVLESGDISNLHAAYFADAPAGGGGRRAAVLNGVGRGVGRGMHKDANCGLIERPTDREVINLSREHGKLAA